MGNHHEADERSSQKETIQMYQDRHEDDLAGPYRGHRGSAAHEQPASRQTNKRARPPRYNDHDDEATSIEGGAVSAIHMTQKTHLLQPRAAADQNQHKGNRYHSSSRASRGSRGPREGSQSKYSQARNPGDHAELRPVK